MVTFNDLSGDRGTIIDGGAIDTNTLRLNSLYGNYIYTAVCSILEFSPLWVLLICVVRLEAVCSILELSPSLVLFSAEDAALDPSAELGDGVTAGGIYSVISRLSDDGSGYAGILRRYRLRR